MLRLAPCYIRSCFQISTFGGLNATCDELNPLVACYVFERLVQKHVQKLHLTGASTGNDGKVNVVLGCEQSEKSICVCTEVVED